MNIKKLSEFKTVLFLILITVILNAITFFLVLRIDSLIHLDLYRFGLIFSNEWANDYWFFKDLLLTFLLGSITIAFLSLIPQYDYSKKTTSFSKWSGILLPAVGIIYETISIIFLLQIDQIVRNDLYQFGINPNSIWNTDYSNIVFAALLLMVCTIILLIIPLIAPLMRNQDK